MSHPLATIKHMAESSSLQFANAVRALSAVAREKGYKAPTFRGPPNLGEHSRTLRRNVDGSITISVVFRGRAWLSTLSDIVEGFVIANSHLKEAHQLRDLLWSVIEEREMAIAQRSGLFFQNHSMHSAA